MVDYDFYCNTYLGSTVPEKAFPAAAARAAAVLEDYERRYRVSCPGPDSRRMALCAMAEVIHGYGSSRFLGSATVGSVSVRFDSGGAKELSRELYRKAGIYLDIRRGVV